MEISRWLCYILINCTIIPYVLAKPFSLNKLIAEESQQKREIITPSPKLSETTTAERFSLNNFNPNLKTKKLKKIEKKYPHANKISPPLKYKKDFQLTNLLKPKKLQYPAKPWQKRKTQYKKRQVKSNEKINRKYIPLIRSLSVLFDNILTTRSSEFNEDETIFKLPRSRYAKSTKGVVCTCALKSDEEPSSNSRKTSAPLPANITVQVSAAKPAAIEASASTANHITASNFRSVGQNTNLPVLPARNTPSSWRDDSRHSARSSTSRYRNLERNITRHHGNSEHNTGQRENDSSARDDVENTYSTSRNSTDSNEFRGELRGRLYGERDDTQNAIEGNTNTEEKEKTAKTKNSYGNTRSVYYGLTGEDSFETGRDKTKSPSLLPELVRHRGFISEDKISTIPKSIQSQETRQESVVDVSYDITNVEGLPFRGSTPAPETKETSPANEGVVTIKDLSDPALMLIKPISQNKPPVVMIIDGYSVARDKNGQSKMSEKSIRIHS